jgi:hypothetical protein
MLAPIERMADPRVGIEVLGQEVAKSIGIFDVVGGVLDPSTFASLMRPERTKPMP